MKLPCPSPATHAPMQQVAVDVIAARDASQLISITHPAAARLMQRVAAQMVVALQQIADAEEAGGMQAAPGDGL